MLRIGVKVQKNKGEELVQSLEKALSAVFSKGTVQSFSFGEFDVISDAPEEKDRTFERELALAESLRDHLIEVFRSPRPRLRVSEDGWVTCASLGDYVGALQEKLAQSQAAAVSIPAQNDSDNGLSRIEELMLEKRHVLHEPEEPY